MYVIPIFCILLVLPASKVTSIGGFIDAVTLTFHGVYGGAAHALLVVMTLCFILALVTSGAVWMIGSDRIQAVAACDGAFFPYFGVFNRRLGTPVRVNVLSGLASSVFCIAGIYLLRNAEHGERVHRRPRHRDLDDPDLLPVDLPVGAQAALKGQHVAADRPVAAPGDDLGQIGSRLLRGPLRLETFRSVECRRHLDIRRHAPRTDDVRLHVGVGDWLVVVAAYLHRQRDAAVDRAGSDSEPTP